MNIKRNPLSMLLGLLILSMVVAGCGASKPTVVIDQKPTSEEAMAEKDETVGEMMEAAATDEAMAAETMREKDAATDEVMAEKDETAGEMMMEEEATTDEALMEKDAATDEAMVEKDEATSEMMEEEAATDEALMEKDAATDEAMSEKEKTTEETTMENEESVDEAMLGPDWFKVELTDVNNGETFKITNFQGKVVLVEMMAVWCPLCTQQQREIQSLHDLLGKRDDLVSLSLDIDPQESADILKTHASNNGFDWDYAVAPTEVAGEISQLYGAQFLNPPATPMLIIDRQGEVHTLPFGIKDAQTLKDAIESYLN